METTGPEDGSDVALVREVMTTPVLTLEADETVAAAAEGMHEAGISSLVVIDADCYPAGIFTSTDVTTVTSEGLDPSSVTIGEYMTADVETVTPDTPLAEAAARLSHAGVKHLPVVDSDDNATGMISTTDFVAVFAGEDTPELDE